MYTYQIDIHVHAGFYLCQQILGGNREGRAGVIIVKQELCVFNCLIHVNKNFINFL